ncbi:Cell division protein FtsI/penicillin-binding protein 2, partial [human gut metagenome]
PVNIFPREVDYAEWEVLRRYPLLNWNMGMVYNLVERDERIYPQGELARRTIGLTGDQGNYGIEEAYRDALAGRDGRACGSGSPAASTAAWRVPATRTRWTATTW